MRGLFAGIFLLGATLIARAEEKKVEEGQPAPNFTLEAATSEGSKMVSLSEYKGKKNVVLFFYPKAMTGG